MTVPMDAKTIATAADLVLPHYGIEPTFNLIATITAALENRSVVELLYRCHSDSRRPQHIEARNIFNLGNEVNVPHFDYCIYERVSDEYHHFQIGDNHRLIIFKGENSFIPAAAAVLPIDSAEQAKEQAMAFAFVNCLAGAIFLRRHVYSRVYPVGNWPIDKYSRKLNDVVGRLAQSIEPNSNPNDTTTAPPPPNKYIG